MNKKKRGRPSSSKLSSTMILESAKKLYFEQQKIPSIRFIASSLNVDAMAIYYYFPNKDTLLKTLSSSLMNEIYEPIENEKWEVSLKKLCISYLKLLKSYPGLLEIMLSNTSKDPAYIFMKRVIKILKPLELSSSDFQNTLSLLADYLHGFSLAMTCSSENSEEFLKLLDGPLEFYIKALNLKK